MLQAVEGSLGMGYLFRVGSVWLNNALLALLVAGCTTLPPRPSTPAERVATPASVSRENPGGDAVNPIDAALTRLVQEPSGFRTDKFRSLYVALPDHGHWRRVRFFGHPTRASFRYGDDAYAMAVVKYFETDNDAPGVCLAKAIEDAAEVAHAFDVELGDFEHELRRHARGSESVDWETRQAKERERRDEIRRRALAWRRHRAALLRKQRLEAMQRAAEERKARQLEIDKAKPAAQSKPDDDATAPAAASAAPPPASATPPPASAAPPPPTAPTAKQDTPKQDRAAVTTNPRAHLVRQRHLARMAIARRRIFVPPPPPPAEPEKPRYDPTGWTWGGADMPVVRTWGQMHTLVNDDRYVAAIAAYHSWPGTCLVQGFAVKVGSDEALAQRVIDRWLDEYAPILAWSGRFKDQPPPIENR